MKNFFQYLKKRPLVKHLLILFFVTIILVWFLSVILNKYTDHGNSVTVPDFSGKTVNDLEQFASEKNLKYEIIDSVFYTGKEKGSVVAQVPPPNTKVKKNRKIYLTIVSSLPERIAMPDFKDLSLRQAKSMIETYGLKLGSFRYIPSEFKDAVLEQLFRNTPIKSGTMILKGSVIDLVIGDGLKKDKVNIPFLYGKTPKEAMDMLKSISLNVGVKIFMDGDSLNGRVYKQKPEYSKKTMIYAGESIDLWFRSEKNFDFQPFLDKLAQDTVKK